VPVPVPSPEITASPTVSLTAIVPEETAVTVNVVPETEPVTLAPALSVTEAEVATSPITN
jgi:hypothetical protein